MIAYTAVDPAQRQIHKPSQTWCTWRCSNLRTCGLSLSLSLSTLRNLYRQASGGPPSVHIAASFFESICYSNKDALSAGIIIAGWDKEVGPSVYNVPLGGGLFRQPWAIGGSGSTYVYGYCDATYKEGWGRDETIEFVKNSK
jgi:20S proteasome alpha/beta subunit